MNFIMETEKTKILTQTAISLSPDKKYLAVCEISEDDITNLNFLAMQNGSPLVSPQSPTPQISIFNLMTQKKVRTLLRPADVGDSHFHCVALSHDGKHCAAVCGGPDYTLVMWHWGQPLRVLGVAKQTTQTTQVSFHPLDNSQICLSGPKTLKIYRLTDGVLKQYNLISGRRDPPTFTAHLWVPEADRILAATDRGDLCVYDRGELHLTLTTVLGSGIGVTGLLTWGKNGFIVVGEKGKIGLFEFAPEEAELYRLKHLVELPGVNEMKMLKDGTSTDKNSGNASSSASSSSSLSSSAIPSISSATILQPQSAGLAPTDPSQLKITAASITPNAGTLACVVGNTQICLLNLSLVETQMTAERDLLCEYVAQGFHSAPITGLSVALRKPLAATCGADGWVRIWNYITMECELAEHFDTETRSISIHPSGFHLVLSCGDRVKLMNIMPTTLDVLKEFPFPQQSGCQEVLFSHGGNLFACAHAKTITLYNTFTGECVGSMRGHIAPVRAISFSPSDSYFYSAGMDGAVYEWNLDITGGEQVKRETESVVSGCAYSGMVVGGGGEKRVVGVCGTDLMLREIVEGNTTIEFATGGMSKRFTKMALIPTSALNLGGFGSVVSSSSSAAAASASASSSSSSSSASSSASGSSAGVTSQASLNGSSVGLACGMASGGIRVYGWPLADTFARDASTAGSSSGSGGTNRSAKDDGSEGGGVSSSSGSSASMIPVCDEYLGHSGSCCGVCLAADGAVLVTAGEDGAVFIWAVQPIDASGKAKIPRWPEMSQFWDANIISKAELDEQQLNISQLQDKIKELNAHSETMLQKKEKQFNEKLDAENSAFEEQLKAKETLIKSLEDQVYESKTKFDEKVTELEEQHLQAMEDMEKVYEHDVQLRQANIKKLQQEKEDLQVKYDGMVTQMQDQFSWKEDKIKQHYLSIDEQNQKAFEGLKEEMRALADRYEQQLREQEDESERELMQLKMTHQAEMAKERKRLKEMDEEILSIQTQLRHAMDDVEPLKQAKNELERRFMEAKATVEQLRNDLRNHDIRMSEHEDTINDKETMIMRLKKENQELDKFKFVLDFKIKELEKTIEPKNEQIAALEEQIQDMDAELEREHRRSTATQLDLKEKDMRMAGLKEENKTLKAKSAKQTRFIEMFRHDLHEILQSEEKQWKEKIKQIYVKFVKTEDEKSSNEGDEQKAQEFARQREFLEKSVTTLKHSLERYTSRGKGEVQQKLDENITLIEEINDLRKEKRELLLKIQEMKKEVAALKAASQSSSGSPQRPGSISPNLPLSGLDGTVSTTSGSEHGGSFMGTSTMGSTTPLLDATASGTQSTYDRSVSPDGMLFTTATGSTTSTGRKSSLKGHLYLSPHSEQSELIEGKTRVAQLLALLEANSEEMRRQQEEINLLRGFMEELAQKAEDEGSVANEGRSDFGVDSQSNANEDKNVSFEHADEDAEVQRVRAASRKGSELSNISRTAKGLLKETTGGRGQQPRFRSQTSLGIGSSFRSSGRLTQPRSRSSLGASSSSTSSSSSSPSISASSASSSSSYKSPALNSLSSIDEEMNGKVVIQSSPSSVPRSSSPAAMSLFSTSFTSPSSSSHQKQQKLPSISSPSSNTAGSPQ
eukprot:MONOS_7334.1-p1 / transcript=MONOS_7334.1 / gene=MONOS_7334 / organism=Monocercomonoides_exilis_PA203 / gene_product=WD repeat-containing protein 65 / transcript_product=WD repeat-containing protein 65 / location=Mono_scaffold00248:50599-55446(+) / protein_length=1615 / sequence_SO=supercontig / SO=protein_coding / is_pseudo=false